MKKLYLFLVFFTTLSNAQDPFITTWQSQGEFTHVYTPVYLYYPTNYTVDFGDGTILTNQTQSVEHFYTGPGPFTMTLSGNFRIMVNEQDKNDILTVAQWGDIQWTDMTYAFSNCSNLTITATDTPDLSQVTSIAGMFRYCSSMNQPLNNWDVSTITDMGETFFNAVDFNQPLDNWDVSNVTSMKKMFSNTFTFNQPLNNWDVSNVTDMSEMFHYSNFNLALNNWDVSNVTNMYNMFSSCSFNNPIDNWDVSNVTNMSFMFEFASFNQPLNNWDVSNVTTMQNMFNWSDNFNQPLDNWNVSNVTNFQNMFNHSIFFNQPLDNWDTSAATNMSKMFKECTLFNQPLNNWDTSNVTNMQEMFYKAPVFNEPLDNWNTSNVTRMDGMFTLATAFNQPLNNWNVSNVTNMSGMFGIAPSFNQALDNWNTVNVVLMTQMFAEATSFNQPLNNWNTSNVINTMNMFAHATSFNQPLNNWDISNIQNLHGMFANAINFNQDISNWNFDAIAYDYMVANSGMDSNNYDALLNRFAELEIQGKQLASDGMHYCDAFIHDYLINDLGWTITGDSLGENCSINTLTGTVRFDSDENGCDENDVVVNNILVNTNNGSLNLTSSLNNGTYSLTLLEDTYTLGLLNVPDYFTVTPPSSTITFTGFGNEDQLNFCLTANEAVNDLNITLLPLNEARPGFESHYRLVAENIGTQTITNATTSLTYNETIQSYTSASQTPASTTANQLNFDLGTILPFETKTIDITMQTFTPPTVNGDEIINFIAAIAPDTDDYTPGDNTFNYNQIVVNSFDPNDKRVLQGDEIYMEQTEGYLDYIIRFQNTGTASAITVRIEDLLHENLDWNTFKPVSASHAYTVEITDGNQVEFTFNNINLPHEDANEPGSHGFIAYKIKPVANIQVGDMITGTAGIFFDFNLPIITNSADTEVVEPPLGIKEYNVAKVSLYPNPASSVLHLQADKGITIENVKIYNLQGGEVLSFEHPQDAIDVKNLSSGLYLVSIETNQGSSNHRLIKK